MMETNVQLTIDGLKARLSNGILTVEFNENATVTSLIKNNRELVKNLNGSEKDPDRNHIVVGNDDVNLGEIIWDPLYRKNKLWQIGKANRTAAFGNELRNYLPRLSFS